MKFMIEQHPLSAINIRESYKKSRFPSFAATIQASVLSHGMTIQVSSVSSSHVVRSPLRWDICPATEAVCLGHGRTMGQAALSSGVILQSEGFHSPL